MGMEYRDRTGRQRRKRRREKAEQDRWASLAGPVEVRRLEEDSGAGAEDEGRAASSERADVPEDQGQS